MKTYPASHPRSHCMHRPLFAASREILGTLCLWLLCSALTEIQGAEAKAVPASKKVQVFILMGQSNMVGMGDLQPDSKPGTLATLTGKEGRYPFLRDEQGQWVVREDVYYYDARVRKGSRLSALSNNGRSIGPELGFGFVMGDFLQAPVLVLKSCIGNRSLGWDLLPPGSDRFEEGGKVWAGYGDTPEWWIEGQPKRQVNWYAGKQYDDDQTNAKEALQKLEVIFPDLAGMGYEIAGFVWWQGHKDQNPVHASRYEDNLVRLVHSLRRDYQVPQARFVLATIGFGGWELEGTGLQIAEAQLALADPQRHPELAGSVQSVEIRDLWRPANESPNPRQGYHYHRNAETYLEVGLRLGEAMKALMADTLDAP